LKLSELLYQDEYRSNSDAHKIEIADLCIHTARMQRGDAFLISVGEKFNPLDHLSEMEDAGVAAIILEDGAELPRKTSIPCFYVPDIRLASSVMASRFYGNVHRSLTLIGITGTNGKTSTARILTHILGASGVRTGYIGTLGVYDGEILLEEYCEGEMTTPTPKALFQALSAFAERGITHVVMEISSHALEQKRIAPLHFALGIFTNLSEEHLDYHKTMENYYMAKRKLFAVCEHALINMDDAYGERLYLEHRGKKSSFGIINDADFRLTDLYENGTLGTQYTCMVPHAEFSVQTPLVGGFNLYNSLAAASAAILLDLCPAQITNALASLPQICGRMERLDLGCFDAPFSVFIDYAHTPDAIEQSLRCARSFTRGRLLVLMGAGGDREREKRAKMGACAEKFADFVFVTSDNSRSEEPSAIIRDIVSGMRHADKRCIIPDRATAIRVALAMAKKDDTVLLLGKGHEEYIIEKSQKKHFSERAIVFAYLEGKKANYDN